MGCSRRRFAARLLALSLRVIVANVVLVLALLALFAFDQTFALVLLLAIAPAAPLIPAMVILNRSDVDWALSLMLALTVIRVLIIPGIVWLGRVVLAGDLEAPCAV